MAEPASPPPVSRVRKTAENSPRQERDCGFAEYAVRRFISSLFYFRLYRRRHPDHPFYVPRAIRRIEGLLPPRARVFEWGSGASTRLYARRAAQVVSVEHDETWHRHGVQALQETGLRNVELRYAPPADRHPADWKTDWPGFAVLKRPPEKPEFYGYMRQIDAFPDGSFDCIAIDGRERAGCLAHALPKLAPTGFIVLDDSHRPRYRPFFEILADWRIERYDFGLIQTTLFIRNPAGAAR